jgi:TPR repeat protein
MPAVKRDNHGYMHQRGCGAKQNDIEASRWFQKAVDQGNSSQVKLLPVSSPAPAHLSRRCAFANRTSFAEAWEVRGTCAQQLCGLLDE